ncbi:CoA-binding protein [Desulfoscipio geothermicus]|uniref:CoA-binding domain-containing protein n=1 Tax=Desulfoscipio geothermicus DSM 3669 TaxID=1121426 RepID=A0A1I6CVX6_9FIRM|nr:CoA-binding protein [Desulfoscipio geothermicus]SFQ97369.1 hypothetical protein SAMN05660706_102168 [Desulfoscipio geothermicus DSM 3669]
MYIHPDDNKIKQILERGRTIAVVGLSDKVHRDSYQVARYMQEKGYRIIPVNPRAKIVLGETAYTNILEIPEKVDIINIFRRSDQVLPIVQDSLKIKPGAIWLQLGIINDEAARLCREAGVDFIMDKCIKVEHARLF